MTDLERAYLRLKCWKLLQGWGQKVGDKINPWDFENRMKNAAQLADWSCAATPPSAEHTNFKV